jgi:hypothetical protein
MYNEESVSYYKHLENLEKIRHTNGSNPYSLPVDNKKIVSITSILGKSSKKLKGFNKNNHNMADCRVIAKFNSRQRLTLKPMLDPQGNL